jgi:uncharacterized repeat protein (TIGR03803 family)
MRQLVVTSALVCTIALTACSSATDPPITSTGVTSKGESRGSTGAAAYQVLHSFGGGMDGNSPYGGLIDVKGTLYGTTFNGGVHGFGTVFSVSTTGAEHVLHAFDSTDGSYPYASLIYVKGTLYGTTFYGGAYGFGTVFSVSATGTEHVLHSFSSGTDGAYPSASLIDVNGTLYGTTSDGGANDSGTVFSVSTTGTEHVLHSFDRSDGFFPNASLIDVNGTLYGTTFKGGIYGFGTIFSVTTTGTEKVLHSFKDSFDSASDGVDPNASLIEVDGTLYGTTVQGGANSAGTVFSVSTTGTEHVLHSFDSTGSLPYASLIDVKGTLYGTTFAGASNSAYGGAGFGTVFSVTTTGTLQVLHTFGTGTDGSNPNASLIDVKGTFYGTTAYGGTYGKGTIFALKR